MMLHKTLLYNMCYITPCHDSYEEMSYITHWSYITHISPMSYLSYITHISPIGCYIIIMYSACLRDPP